MIIVSDSKAFCRKFYSVISKSCKKIRLRYPVDFIVCHIRCDRFSHHMWHESGYRSLSDFRNFISFRKKCLSKIVSKMDKLNIVMVRHFVAASSLISKSAPVILKITGSGPAVVVQQQLIRQVKWRTTKKSRKRIQASSAVY